MKNINYLLLFCCIPTLLCASDKTSPEKYVAFKNGIEEPLLHVARSVSSDGPPFEEGMRMQKMVVTVPPISEEVADPIEIAIASRSVRRAAIVQTFTFEAHATDDTPAVTPPRPILRPSPSPRNGIGAALKSPKHVNVVPSPRNSSGGGGGSRRGSKDSFDDDPEIRAYISAMCDISGKNTRSTQQHFRRLRAQQKEIHKGVPGELIASDSLQTIDGEAVRDDNFVIDSVGLNTHSRDGSAASHGDTARDEWLPLSQQGELTPERLKYLKDLKVAVKQTEHTVSAHLRSAGANDFVIKASVRKALAPLFRAHYRNKSGVGVAVNVQLKSAEDLVFSRDIEQARQLGCCAGCCSCCSLCVIL